LRLFVVFNTGLFTLGCWNIYSIQTI
jgi:hypothetical protein